MHTDSNGAPLKIGDWLQVKWPGHPCDGNRAQVVMLCGDGQVLTSPFIWGWCHGSRLWDMTTPAGGRGE